jgi:hypothetical protein
MEHSHLFLIDEAKNRAPARSGSILSRRILDLDSLLAQ